MALLLLPLLTSCASQKIYSALPLSKQILLARTGYDGKLTNSACTEYDGKECKTWSMKTYDISDKKVREELITLSFVCNIGGRRFHVCENEPAFCRYTYDCNWWQDTFGGCERQVERVNATPYQFLLDSSLKCFSEKAYSWTEIK